MFGHELRSPFERLHDAIVVQHRKVPLAFMHVSPQDHKKECGRLDRHSKLIVSIKTEPK
jgi:hypothetical protein